MENFWPTILSIELSEKLLLAAMRQSRMTE